MCTTDVVAYNTEEMQAWANGTKSAGDAFEEMVGELYSLIDNFVADEFTGDLSVDFSETVLSQREYYTNLADIIDEAAKTIEGQAATYTDNSDMLSSRIHDNNIGGN